MKSAPRYPFLCVGVTGGIGSGKSTVCRLFADMGRVAIVADEVARNLADQDDETKTAIRSAFGPEVYLSNGRLDRKTVASIVFGDEERRKKLDSIIHPRVFTAVDQQLDALPSAKSLTYVLIEAALIYESGMNDRLDYTVVVTANRETCIQRVMARDDISREEVRQRMSSQMPVSEKVQRGDFVIHNNNTVTDLRLTVLFLDTILLQLHAARVP